MGQLSLEDAKEALRCAGAAVSYVQETQRDAVPHLRLPRRYNPSGYVVLDGSTQRNLELDYGGLQFTLLQISFGFLYVFLCGGGVHCTCVQHRQQ